MPDSERVETLLAGAAQLPPEQRAAYLDAACRGDAALRAEVDSLLRALRDAGTFLSAPTRADATLPTRESPLREGPGARIGPYKLLQLIGEGGFGSVFMAEQERPVARKVALKIIKLGMDTRQVIARFEAERQALAMMDHPNIARVLDAGATEQGRPYFVMDLVKGDPISEYCDKNNLSIEGRLELFAQVCLAVQHAHTKGIIHRDIKPSNILVSTQDGRPAAKVIDFGIAKATASRLTEKTLFTEHKQLIGTPEYMSPEQAEGSLDIDTRTDIYSLGVLLYELLTGSTPFKSEDLRSAAYAEIQRIIREVEPPKPSTRLSQNTDTIASVAARRSTEPRKLGAVVRGELDWIVMKALEKDRSRRYDTANGLAMDIRRYLAGEAVVAAPPSAAYRFRTFVRRHKGPVAASCLVALVLILGIIGTTTGLVRAVHASRRAALEESKATAAATSEAQARRRAETISDFVIAALQSSDATEGGREDMTVVTAMKNAVADLDTDRFADDAETEAKLRQTIGHILRNNGDLKAAESLASQSLAMYQKLHNGDHPDVARALNQLAKACDALGQAAEAERLTQQSLEMYRRLRTGDDPDLAALLNNLGHIKDTDGRAAEAEPLLKDALAMLQRLHAGDHRNVAQCMDNLAKVYDSMGRYSEAEPLYVGSIEMRRRLYKGDHPDLATGLNNLAVLRSNSGRAEEALALQREALQINRRLYKGDHPAVARDLANLAVVLSPRNPAEAESLIAEALEMNRRLYKGDHQWVAHGLYTLGSVRLEMGRAAEAEPVAVESTDMYKRLFKGDHVGVAMSTVLLARTHQALGKSAQAQPEFDDAVAMLRRLMPDGSPMLARTLWQSGSTRLAANDPAAALPLLKEALSMGERLLQPGHAQIAKYRDTLTRCEQNLATPTNQP